MTTELATPLLLPPFPLATAISPFMAATLFQLALGNIILGVIEAIIIGRLMGVPWKSIVGRVIAANYFVTIAGGFVLTILAESAGPRILGPEPVFGVGRYLAFMAAAGLVLAWVLQWLVVRPVFRDRAGKTFAAVGLAKVASYLIVVLPLYFALTTYSLGGMKRATVAEVTSDPGAIAMYLSPDLRSLVQVRLDGSGKTSTADIGEQGTGRTELWLYPSEHGADLWQTAARAATPGSGDRVLAKYIASDYPAAPAGEQAVDLRPGGGAWDVSAPVTEYAPRKGLRGQNRETGERVLVAVDTPFVSWNARNATLLPGDRVLFQLGHQIILADLVGRKMAVVGFGHSPVVVPSHLVQTMEFQ